ncbi:ATP-binding protein [Rhodocytophaga aerolata]|uniref:histidine kinase n=1 Tax=Rhodocytophaga aerolata TaxID=455078 RepID=A0ABT8RDI0_9BACT|nr:ATP-binding protein [Rhodocytophaga aerolata]MDO1450155.1 ATP-binding protein [Rhodocytophaga aerolata]
MLTRGIILIFVWLSYFSAFGPAMAQLDGPVFSSKASQGMPFIRNYSPKEYKAHVQNWAIIQDSRGRMFFGNGDGVLVFDNEQWRLTPLPNYDHARSLAFSSDSLLYVGGNNELGYLQENVYGQYEYKSLVNRLPEEERGFDRVRTVIDYNKQLFFQTYERLFVWDGNAFTIHRFDQKLHRIFLVNGKLYGVLEDKGLVYWEDNGFKELPHGATFAHKPVTMMLPYDKDKLLIGIQEGELYMYSPQGVEFFETEAAPYLKQTLIVKGCYINDTHIALGSAGLVVIDKQGKLISYYNEKSSLQDKNILHMFPDRDGNLWLGLQVGISKIAFGSPVKIINEQLGIKGAVRSISQHQGQLLVLTSNGLFLEKSDDALHHRFQHIDSLHGQVFTTYSHHESLLVGTETGIKKWKNGKLDTLFDYGYRGCFKMQASIFNPTHLWAVLDDGLALLTYQQGTWQELGAIRGLAGAIRNLVQLKPNELWLGTRSNGMYTIHIPMSTDSILDFSRPTISQLGPAQHLPKGEVYSYLINGQLYVWNEITRQVYQWNEKKELFDVQPNFGDLFGISGKKVRPWTSEDAAGKVYLKVQDTATGIIQIARATNTFNGAYRTEIVKVPSGLSYFESCLFALEKEVWYGGSDGVLHHDLSGDKDKRGVAPVIISKVTYNQQPYAFKESQASLPYKKNAVLRFNFSSPTYPEEGHIRYQSMLEGFDEQWSDFQKQSYREYTNLWEGTYVFKIRALHPSGYQSATTSFPLKITPPWYREQVFYVLYLILLATLVYGFVRIRSYQLRKKNKQLEIIVANRTEEVMAQAEQLKQQAQQLQELDEFKSRFFANISHEFRTPLTLINGPVQTLLFGNPEPKVKQQLSIIQRNARHLLKLVNQLLDLSRIESHKLKLKVSMGNIVEAVRIITMELESAATSKGLALTFQASQEELWVYYEPDKLEKIVGNLVANAIKFTDQGSVCVKVTKTIKQGKEYAAIEVADTGIGIAQEQVPYVFDRFFQVDSSSVRQYEGTGIGLSLAKELVLLHGGEITVESKLGEGTTFFVFFVMGHDHFDAENIAILSSNEFRDTAGDKPAELTKGIVQENMPGSDQEEKPVILLVEDNADLRYYLHTQLEEFYKIEEAENGKAGLQKALEVIPDLLISDVMMPLMDGYTLCEQIKNDERTNHIPVILLTARSTIENKLQGLETGADEYLIKPFTPAELQLKVKNLIQTRQALREKFGREFRLQPTDVVVPSQQHQFLEQLKHIIERHMEDETFGVEELCRELGMSRTQVNRKLQALVKQTPSELIKSFRLQRATELIRQDAGNMAEIAYKVGFNSQSYFTRAFQDAYGCTPMEYKRQSSKETLLS